MVDVEGGLIVIVIAIFVVVDIVGDSDLQRAPLPIPEPVPIRSLFGSGDGEQYFWSIPSLQTAASSSGGAGQRASGRQSFVVVLIPTASRW